MTQPPAHYEWRPIEDLPADWRALIPAEYLALEAEWLLGYEEVKGSEEAARLNKRLGRLWAIETGVIEGIYTIDRGTTNLLIERGVAASLIPHGASFPAAELVVEIIKDHESVLEALFDFVARGEELTPHFIRSLHQSFCRHQETIQASTSDGGWLEIPLLRGAWKAHPNNPTRSDGAVHEYCPPLLVNEEIERLLEFHRRHADQSVHPLVEAAWLHHRFTQIHPFQDGNGRVARALATLVLLRGRLLPFVVERGESRGAYVDALEAADNGRLESFVSFMADCQISSIGQVLPGIKRAIMLRGLRELQPHDIERGRRHVEQQRHEMWQVAAARLEEFREELESAVQGIVRNVHQSNSETRSRFAREVDHMAERAGYGRVRERDHQWLALELGTTVKATLVISFHHMAGEHESRMAGLAFLLRDDAPDLGSLRPLGGEHLCISVPQERKGWERQLDTWLERIFTDLVSALQPPPSPRP